MKLLDDHGLVFRPPAFYVSAHHIGNLIGVTHKLAILLVRIRLMPEPKQPFSDFLPALRHYRPKRREQRNCPQMAIIQRAGKTNQYLSKHPVGIIMVVAMAVPVGITTTTPMHDGKEATWDTACCKIQ